MRVKSLFLAAVTAAAISAGALSGGAHATTIGDGGGGCSYAVSPPYVSFGYAPPFGIVGKGNVYCYSQYGYRLCLQWYSYGDLYHGSDVWYDVTPNGCATSSSGWMLGNGPSSPGTFYTSPPYFTCPGVRLIVRTAMQVTYKNGSTSQQFSAPVWINC
jgi:hypothetical protein